MSVPNLASPPWISFSIYSVETENIEKVVALYGPSTKVGAIVGGQVRSVINVFVQWTITVIKTSVKEPEIRAFDKHLPKDVHIVTCHSLHGPQVNPAGQPLVCELFRLQTPTPICTVRLLYVTVRQMLRSNELSLFLDTYSPKWWSYRGKFMIV